MIRNPQWVETSTSITVFDPHSGAQLRFEEVAPNVVEVDWLWVDPTGTHPPQTGSATSDEVGTKLRELPIITDLSAECSEDRFFELVDAVPDMRLELIDGQVVAMAGAGWPHHGAQTGVVQALGALLRGGPCVVLGSDVYVAYGDGWILPDVVVQCEKRKVGKAKTDGKPVLTNPTMVVEIVSPTSAERDQVDKPAVLMKVGGPKVYLAVDPVDRSVMLWRAGQPEPENWRDGEQELLGVQVPIGLLFEELDRLNALL